MFKDMTFLAIGVADYLKTSRLQVVDRCLLSQLVYGSIRAGHLFINPVNTALMLISAEEIVRSMILNLRSRKFDTELNYDREVELVTFNFLILLPEIELLRSQRIRAGKDYPFDPIVELTRYKGLSSTLTMVAQDFLVQNDSTDRSMIQLRLLEVEFKDYDQLNKTLSKANLLP